jgi:hypothetical protein
MGREIGPGSRQLLSSGRWSQSDKRAAGRRQPTVMPRHCRALAEVQGSRRVTMRVARELGPSLNTPQTLSPPPLQTACDC